LKTGTSSYYVVVPQRIKEDALLNFVYEDRSDRLEKILRSAGVTEEQYVQFPIDDRFVNPERSSDDITELSKCMYM
jgi:uracil-DNA glycosylase